MTTRILFTIIMNTALGAFAWGAGGGPIPLNDLTANADVIAVATVKGVQTGAQQQTITLELVNVLKGQSGSVELVATLSPPAGLRGSNGVLEQSAIGQTGVWFLKAISAGYQAISVFENPVKPSEVFFPVTSLALATSPAGSTLQQRLLNFELAAYQALPAPGLRDDFQLMSAIVSSNSQDAATAASTLMGSVSLQQHVMGLAAAIRLGSPSAIVQVANEFDTLKSSPKFGHIIATIEGFQPSRTAEIISAFQALIELHSDIPGFDRAISTSFVAIANVPAATSKLPAAAALPGIVALLDSTDPNTQIRAARFLGSFTLFADANGNIPGTGITGPFAADDTRQYTPSNSSGLTAAQYAGYWKVWWAQNKAKLGY